ncbi:lasso peptide biosynthesis B2 protein [Streptomyces kunmingensis]|uniref:Lasso peptide biosynthesis B2 protein n=1 Tax=Streptomyces kunmingensis TaxID=68225 RepID=A0ABU6CQA3_9ACTN|nr:lasso peptide biosynthesis B2 protein [Streptomyces kunmingensis]MEB3966136.1 lasso peptide biosynthesis B2 protein [Streptomyces kunmingensis]
MTRLSVSEYVRESTSAHGGSVLLDVRSGHCFAMNSMAHTLWQEWHRSGNFDSAVLVLAGRYPDLQHDRIREDARRLADDLISRGLLTAHAPSRTPPAAGQRTYRYPAADAAPLTAERAPATAGPRPDGRGSAWHGHAPSQGEVPPVTEVPLIAAQMTMAAEPVRNAGDRSLHGAVTAVLGLVALLGALLLIRLPLRTVSRTVSWTARTWCRREATPEQASASLAAVRRATRWYPGRAACLELSLATLGVLAITGRRVEWCIGTADDPYRFHAWVEAQGVAIASPDEYGHTEFRRVLGVS